MRNIILKFVISILIILTTACHKHTSLSVQENFNGILSAKEWKAIGPFEYDTLKQKPINTFKNRDLDLFDIDEEKFTEKDLNKLEKSKYKPFIIKCYNSPIKLFDYANKSRITNKSNFYLFTTIYSESEKEIIFIFDGSRNYKIWINNHKVLEVLNKENAIKNGDRFVKIKLLKGLNTVFAKVNRGINQYSWGLLMTLSSTDIAKKIYKENYLTDFVNDPVISDSIPIYIGPYSNANFIIADENVKLNENLINYGNTNNNVNSQRIPNGLYQSELVIENDTLTQFIFKGDIFQYINRLKSEAKQIICDKSARNDIKSSIERIDFLIEKLDLSSEAARKYYHRNLLYYTIILNDLLNYVKKYEHDRLLYGISIKTYVSKEDASINHFLIHINKNLVNKNHIPLILFVPYSLVDSTMIRGWSIGNLDQIEMDRKMADDYGFAVAWLFLKGIRYSPINAINDTKRVIERIKRDYNLDTSKIFLVGECAGGKRALLLAETFPNLFSGVAVSSPEIDDLHEGNNPMTYSKILYTVPLCIRHGKDDDVVPIEWTEKFVNKAKREGVSIKFIKTETGHLNLSRDERRYAFIFFDSIKNTQKRRIVSGIR